MLETERSFLDKEIAKKGSLIHKIKAKDSTGEWAYYFVLVQRAQEAVFLKAIEEKKLSDLRTYGKIIASCYGEEPTEATKTLLKEKYDFEV